MAWYVCSKAVPSMKIMPKVPRWLGEDFLKFMGSAVLTRVQFCTIHCRMATSHKCLLGSSNWSDVAKEVILKLLFHFLIDI